MTWRLRIEHLTTVTYAGPVRASFNEARMTPLTTATQRTREAHIAVGPRSVPVSSYDDYWGTRVSVFDLPEAHDDLWIRATATVDTQAPPPHHNVLNWDAIAQATATATATATAAGGRLLEFCLPTPLTTLEGGIAEGVRGVRDLPPDEAAVRISARVRDRIEFVPGATGINTGAQEAWDKGQGVCQDLAHVTAALLRAAGLPARYVSGYLHPNPRAEPGSTAAGQGHAWVEYWAGEWAPLDPTHGAPVAERHVVVARGRDYDDVQPLKGVYDGPSRTDMDVTVEVTRLA